jgi:hypothetical protein
VFLWSCSAGGDSGAKNRYPAETVSTDQPPTDTAPGPHTLDCDEHIGTTPPPAGMRIVEGVVALPASPGIAALGTSLTGSGNDAHRLFAKWGLTIRAGRTFSLLIPSRLTQVASIGWGSSARPVVRLTVPGCQSGRARWLSYAGGYWVRRPLCLPLRVVVQGRTRTVRIGVGAACPGQAPTRSNTQR